MARITLLDGSIGQELIKRNAVAPTPLWSTQVMIDRPDLVGQLHADFFDAGATVATTNTYAIHRSRLDRAGLSDQIPHLVATAVAQAEAARETHRGSGRIAGSLGPLLASYRPDLNPDPDEAATRFEELVVLMKPGVDLFLIETVSSVREAEGALRATVNCGKPVWLALSVMDTDGTRLRSGERVEDVASLVSHFDPEAVLVNCCRPEAIPAALQILQGLGRPFGAYANGFTQISPEFLKDAPTADAFATRTDLDPKTYAKHAMDWVDRGATIIGGCCEVGPAHIAEMARRLRAANPVIV